MNWGIGRRSEEPLTGVKQRCDILGGTSCPREYRVNLMGRWSDITKKGGGKTFGKIPQRILMPDVSKNATVQVVQEAITERPSKKRQTEGKTRPQPKPPFPKESA